MRQESGPDRDKAGPGPESTPDPAAGEGGVARLPPTVGVVAIEDRVQSERLPGSGFLVEIDAIAVCD